MSVLDRLTQTHPVWLLLTLSEEEARHILLKQPPQVRHHQLVHKYQLWLIIAGLNLGLHVQSCAAGVFGPEVSRPAEEDSVCSCWWGTVWNQHQPLPHQREQVQ